MAAAPRSPYSNGLMAGALANSGQADQAAPILSMLRADSYGGPIGLAVDSIVRGDIEMAVEWAGKAAEQRFPVFIPRVVRPYEPLLRQSAAWPRVLKAMNLLP